MTAAEKKETATAADAGGGRRKKSGSSRQQQIADFLIDNARKHPGRYFTYQEIAKAIYQRHTMPKKTNNEVKLVSNSAGPVRKYLIKMHGYELDVANSSMLVLMMPDEIARKRLPKTEKRVVSAHTAHNAAMNIVDPRKVRDVELRQLVETRYSKIALMGEKIFGLLPTRKADRG